MKKYTRNDIVQALTNLGQSLGIGVLAPKGNADGTEGDLPEGEAIVVQFVQNEAEPDPELIALGAMVKELGGVEKVKEALSAGLAFQAKANAEREAEQTHRNELVEALSANEGLGMTKEELDPLPTRVLEGLSGNLNTRQNRVDYSALSAGNKANAQAKIAPRPSILRRAPASQTAQ